ncbi:MAG: GntR family transcriptional regulator [Pseudomonadota bacterium]
MLSKKEACFEDLKAQILTQALAPGSELDEASLSEAYGVSRTPMREVIHRLAGEGFVSLTANRGAKVVSMDLATMRVFFQTAPLVYCNIARLAAENRTPHQLDTLKSIQKRFAEAVDAARPAEMAMENHRFHELFGEMAANDYLVPSLRRLLIDHTRLAQMFYRPAAPAEQVAIKQASQQHDAMIFAIEAQEIDVVVDLTLQHWGLSRDRIERFVRPDPLPLEPPEALIAS